MPAQLIEGKKIANKIKDHLREEIESLKRKGELPSLSAIQVGENPGCNPRGYVEFHPEIKSRP